MTTAIPEAPTRMKFCRGCKTRLPIDRFRLANKSKGYRHSRCGDCRRDETQRKKADEWQSSVNLFCRRVLELKTPDALLKFTNRFCEVAGTTPLKLFEKLATYTQSGECSAARRINISKAVLHIQAFAELAIVQAQPKLDDPEKIVRELHRTHNLTPTLRQMYAEGVVALDDLDPPPSGPEFEEL